MVFRGCLLEILVEIFVIVDVLVMGEVSGVLVYFVIGLGFIFFELFGLNLLGFSVVMIWIILVLFEVVVKGNLFFWLFGIGCMIFLGILVFEFGFLIMFVFDLYVNLVLLLRLLVVLFLDVVLFIGWFFLYLISMYI